MLNFREVSSLCRQAMARKHPKASQFQQTIDYLEQVFKYMGQLNVEYVYNEAASKELSLRIKGKVQQMLGV